MDRSLQPGYSRRGIVLARLCFLLSSIQCSDACQHYVRTLTSLNVRSRRALGSWHYIHISGGVWCAWHHLIYCCPVFVDVVNPSSRFIDPGCKSTRRHHADAIVFFVPKTTNEPSTGLQGGSTRAFAAHGVNDRVWQQWKSCCNCCK